MEVGSMIRVDISKLKKGDIILSTSTKFQSKVIRFFTDSDISHAMICVANGSVMDSTGEGVHARNIEKMFYDDSCAIYAYRLKAGISDSEMQAVLAYVRSETGSPYTTLGAISSVVLPKIKGGGQQFCSRLVARAYEKAGINITTNPDTCTPADIQESPLLELIPDAVIPVSDADIENLKKEGDTTVAYRDIESRLLKNLRDIRPNIRVINDIDKILLDEPALDNIFAAIFLESGYLEFWQVERNRFPWRYDETEIVAFYNIIENKEDLIGYCENTISNDAGGKGDFMHWDQNLVRYTNYEREKGLRTFSLIRELYVNLASGHKLRVESANFLVRKYNGQNRASILI
ncbi:YiiX/YebB-like N1pC/P60 family cysteine hydrolase [Pseudomonas sp. VI4.1]|uniref:YiiX/YebB-like N1pC/P60 family cysteine hydrolase n=1 Tax=Pseudomonas sp. VI4.1 TaxID=1941346 RepID=UPI0010081235|nr:YiiX/YebB-like N1pC/P60 family cysteine hydrolase [Pseudomonas sp. VI4.1]